MNEIDEIILKMIQDDYPHRNIKQISVLENNDRYFVTYRSDNQYQWGSDVIKKPFENPEVNPQDGTVKGVYIL